MAVCEAASQIDWKLLQCPGCNQQFAADFEWLLLPCLHRFCGKCVEEHDEKLPPGSPSLCPACNVPVDLPEGALKAIENDPFIKYYVGLVKLAEELRVPSQEKTCNSCDKVAAVVAYCGDCGGFICEGCYLPHKSMKSLKSHEKVIALQEVTNGKVAVDLRTVANLFQPPKCETHRAQVLDRICSQCNVEMCVACGQGDHHGHDFESIQTVAKRSCHELSNAIQKVEDLETAVEDFKHEMERIYVEVDRQPDDIYKKSQNEIEQQLQALKEKLQRCKAKAEKKIATIESDHREEVENLIIKKNEQIEVVTRKLQEEELGVDQEMTELNQKAEKLKDDVDDVIKRIKETASKYMLDIKVPLERKKHSISTAGNVMNLTNDWLTLKILPDLCKSFRALIHDLDQLKPNWPTLEPIKLKAFQHIISQLGFAELRLKRVSSFSLKDFLSEDFEPNIIGCGNGRLAMIMPTDETFQVCMFTLSGMLDEKSDEIPCDGGPVSCLLNSNTLLVAGDTKLWKFNVDDLSCVCQDLDFRVGPMATNPPRNHIIVVDWTSSLRVLNEDFTDALEIPVADGCRSVSQLCTTTNDIIVICDWRNLGCFGVNYKGETVIKYAYDWYPHCMTPIGDDMYIAGLEGGNTKLTQYDAQGKVKKTVELSEEMISCMTSMRLEGEVRLVMFSCATASIILFD